MEQVKLTRRELYDLVWTEPLSRLAKRFKISDIALRKINALYCHLFEFKHKTIDDVNCPFFENK